MDCSFFTNIAFQCLTLAQAEAPVVEAVDEKLKNIEADLDRFEDINQKLTLAQQEQKGLLKKWLL